MIAQTKRPTIRPGDLAYVPSRGLLGSLPLFVIQAVKTDADGTVTDCELGERDGHSGIFVPVQFIAGVFHNILGSQE